MPGIANIEIYNESMTKSLIDKLFSSIRLIMLNVLLIMDARMALLSLLSRHSFQISSFLDMTKTA